MRQWEYLILWVEELMSDNLSIGSDWSIICLGLYLGLNAIFVLEYLKDTLKNTHKIPNVSNQ
jgi:hypothetical protein